MSNVIDFGAWKRERLGVAPPTRRRARAVRRKGENPASIGDLSQQLLELLRHK